MTTAGPLAGTSTPPSDSAGSATAATGSVPVKQTGAQLLASFPPRPIVPSWPATEVGRAAVLARVLSPPFALDNALSQQTRRLGVLAVLSWLQTSPGASWQQRWQASGAEDQLDWRDLLTAASAGRARSTVTAGGRLPHLGPGLLVLICADVIRPSLRWLLRFAPARRGLAAEMARTRDTAAFAALAESCTQARVGLQTGQQALTRIAVILAAKGGERGDQLLDPGLHRGDVGAGLIDAGQHRAQQERVVVGEVAVQRLDEIPGVGVTAAHVIVAEIGVDMSRFATAAHLASWARFAPGIKESAGKKKGRGSTGHGNPYLARVLGEAAVTAGKTDTFLGERYRRIARRRGKKKAIVAIGRSILVIVWHLLSDPEARFHDLGSEFYDTRIGPDRNKRNHIRQLEALGYKVTLEPAA